MASFFSMMLRRQVLFVKVSSWLIAVSAAIVAAGELRISVLYFLPAVVVAVWLTNTRVPMMLARRAFRRLTRDMNGEDFLAARKTLAELRDAYAGSSSGLEQLRLHEATILCLEQNYDEAARLFQSIDRRLIGKRWEPWLLNNLAWSLALSGEAARAVVIARESLLSSEKHGVLALSNGDLRSCQLGTLGTALALAGQEEEAVPLLLQALARGGTPRQQAARALYLGDAEKTRGKVDESNAAYERALREGPSTSFAEKARDRLRSQKAYRT